ncbi:MAG: hypothetical protein JWQ20_1939 [Conexibacter sp.]|nr:hypothetical protein [Conexibacter sp.]
MPRSLAALGLVVLCLLSVAPPVLAASSPAPQPAPPAQAAVEVRVDALEGQLATERAVREKQGDDGNFYFGAVAIIVGVGTLLIAVVAIAFTFAGYRLVRDYVEKEFDRRANAAFAEQIGPLVDAKLQSAIAGYDEEYAKLVAATRKATGQEPDE